MAGGERRALGHNPSGTIIKTQQNQNQNKQPAQPGVISGHVQRTPVTRHLHPNPNPTDRPPANPNPRRIFLNIS